MKAIIMIEYKSIIKVVILGKTPILIELMISISEYISETITRNNIPLLNTYLNKFTSTFFQLQEFSYMNLRLCLQGSCN